MLSKFSSSMLKEAKEAAAVLNLIVSGHVITCERWPAQPFPSLTANVVVDSKSEHR